MQQNALRLILHVFGNLTYEDLAVIELFVR